MKLKLDQKIVNTLTLPKGVAELFAWDDEVSNFGLRLRRGASGVHKSFVAQYRQHARSRRSLIGSADKLSLAQARAAAKRLLARVQLGADPQGERDAKRIAALRSFAGAAEAYLTSRTHWRGATRRLAELYLVRGSYFRPLHSVPLAQISRADFAARLTPLSPATALAARRHLNSLLSWCVAEGWLETNPLSGRRLPSPPSRDRVLSDAELRAIWGATGADDFGCIVKLLVLTGARRQEIGGMQWSELDELTASLWTLPAERSKNRRSFTLPLPPPATEIIRAVSRNGRPFVFGERAAAGYATWSRGKRELDARLGDSVAPWRLHDLRRTVATRLADIGILPHIIEAVLNHASGHKAGVAGTYNRSVYGAAVKAALARWAEYVTALAEGRQSNIVTLHA
jgi:integrase